MTYVKFVNVGKLTVYKIDRFSRKNKLANKKSHLLKKTGLKSLKASILKIKKLLFQFFYQQPQFCVDGICQKSL
jgi:hypothetical protein